MNVLGIEVDREHANYPTVRVLIDGRERLVTDGILEPNHPRDLLDTGALLPTDPPTRIAFYGCGCGEFGCANVAGLITRTADRVEWSDFRSLTGAYGSALPEPEDRPDPFAKDDPDDEFYGDSELSVGPFSFDADQYVTTVRAAMDERGWETHTQAVAREVRAIREDLWPFPARRRQRVELTARRPDGRLEWEKLDVPDGDPAEVAASLVSLLAAGHSLRRIRRRRLWR